jgi:hypothetical protein
VSDVVANTGTVEPIIEAVGVEKSYPQPDGTRIQVIGATNLAVETGKIIALLAVKILTPRPKNAREMGTRSPMRGLVAGACNCGRMNAAAATRA